jgi:hypothetical protein
MSADRWAAALREHDEVLADFVRAIERLDSDCWHRPMGPGRWSPAALTMHVIQSYELGRAAMAGGASMRVIVPRPVSWLARNIALPIFLARRTFPKGAEAPAEVRPDLGAAASLSQSAACAMLHTVAQASIDALRNADRSADRGGLPRRFVHAIFGPLEPLLTVRLVSAHTRHHGLALVDLH